MLIQNLNAEQASAPTITGDELQKLWDEGHRLRDKLREHLLETKGAQRKFLKRMWKSLVQRFGPEKMRFFVMHWAKRGDWEPLAVHIEDGGVISDEIRQFVVEILRGERAKPNNRAPSAIAMIKSGGRALFVLAEEQTDGGKTRDPAIDKAARVFGVDRRTIQYDLKKWETHLKIIGPP